MKAGRLIEILQTVSPNTEVGCEIGDSPSLTVSNLFDLERIPEYEVESVLTTPNTNEITELLNKINTRYKTDLKLKTINIITASTVIDIDEDGSLRMMDIYPEHDTYIFDAEEIIPILKNKIEKK